MPGTATDSRDLKAILDDLGEKTEQVEALATRLEDGSTSSEDQKAIKDELNGLSESVKSLEAEKELRLAEEGQKAMKAEVKSLRELVEELRQPGNDGFEFAGGVPVEGGAKAVYAEDSPNSFYNDVRLASRGGPGQAKALERLQEVAESAGRDVKAMVEGTDSAGGYLVAPEISDELVRLKHYATPLRNLFSQINVTSDTLQIAQQTGGLTAGWVDELATKPAADFTFGQISVSVFTAAGLAVVSNQLLADARPSIDGLINTDIAKRIGRLEEIAFINGSGSGQPRGILNTSGVGTTTYTDASPTAGEILDKIVDSIAGVQTDGKTEPTDIVLHPKTWTTLIKDRASDGHYTIENQFSSRSPQSALPSRTLFGVPVTLCYNMPTNLGTGTNETRIIVGDFKQGLILDRQGITVDDSSHVYFTSNQTVFRGESRVGFTAGRDPKAFNVIGGTGLIVS